MRVSPPTGENRARSTRENTAITETTSSPLIIGHRGAAGHAPENSRAAFAAAVRMGVDAVDFDVQFSADGWPVVLHDETLLRMAGVGVRVTDYPESALKGFDIGFLHGDRWRGLRLPSVAEVARMVPAECELHVELKDYRPAGPEQLRRLFDVLQRHGGLDRVVVSSPHEEQLTEVAGIRPEVRKALLLFRSVKVPIDAARRAALLGCTAVNPNADLVDEELTSVCHRNGMKVYAFTVNERGTMRRLETIGVDGFFTDYPDRLRGVAS